ncbi:MAG: hypothetical protein WCJ39_10650 [bacterium]
MENCLNAQGKISKVPVMFCNPLMCSATCALVMAACGKATLPR